MFNNFMCSSSTYVLVGRLLICIVVLFACLTCSVHAQTVLPTDGSKVVYSSGDTLTYFQVIQPADSDLVIDLEMTSDTTSEVLFVMSRGKTPDVNIYDYRWLSSSMFRSYSFFSTSCDLSSNVLNLAFGSRISGKTVSLIFKVNAIKRPCYQQVDITGPGTIVFSDQLLYLGDSLHHYKLLVPPEVVNQYTVVISYTRNAGSAAATLKLNYETGNDLYNDAYKVTKLFTSDSNSYIVLPTCKLVNGTWYFSVTSTAYLNYQITFSVVPVKCLTDIPIGNTGLTRTSYGSFSTYEMDQNWLFYKIDNYLPLSGIDMSVKISNSDTTEMFAKFDSFPSATNYDFSGSGNLYITSNMFTQNKTLYYGVKTSSKTTYSISFIVNERKPIELISSGISTPISTSEFTVNTNRWNYYSFYIENLNSTSVLIQVSTSKLSSSTGSFYKELYLQKGQLPNENNYWKKKTVTEQYDTLFFDVQSWELGSGWFYVGIKNDASISYTPWTYVLNYQRTEKPMEYPIVLMKATEMETSPNILAAKSMNFYKVTITKSFSIQITVKILADTDVDSYKLYWRESTWPTVDFYDVTDAKSLNLEACKVKPGTFYLMIRNTANDGVSTNKLSFTIKFATFQHECQGIIPPTETSFIPPNDWSYYKLPIYDGSENYRFSISTSGNLKTYLGPIGEIPTRSNALTSFVTSGLINSCLLSAEGKLANSQYLLGLSLESSNVYSYTIQSEKYNRSCVVELTNNSTIYETIRPTDSLSYSFINNDLTIQNGLILKILGSGLTTFIKYGKRATSIIYDYKYTSSSINLLNELLGKQGVWYITVYHGSYSTFWSSQSVAVSLSIDKCFKFNSCSGNGICSNGVCYCYPDYIGQDCSYQTNCVDSKCGGNGICKYGQCFCLDGTIGETCSSSCSSGCVNGVCHRGTCYCNPGVTGIACNISLSCPNNCNNNGECFNGKCYCNPDFSGIDCNQKVSCSGGCGNGGICKFGQCYCTPGYTGFNCFGGKGCEQVPNNQTRLNASNRWEMPICLLYLCIIILISFI